MISPKMRRDARQRAVQFLFGLDFTKYTWESAIEAYWAGNPARPGVREYAERLIRGVSEHAEELDRELDSAIERWAPARVGPIERAILRVGLYELRHAHDVPPSVAINEAVEVAKRFGSDESPRFINGVLDRLKEPRANSCESL